MIPNTAERECRGEEEEEGVGRERGKGEKPGAESSPSPIAQALYLVYQELLFT